VEQTGLYSRYVVAAPDVHVLAPIPKLNSLPSVAPSALNSFRASVLSGPKDHRKRVGPAVRPGREMDKKMSAADAAQNETSEKSCFYSSILWKQTLRTDHSKLQLRNPGSNNENSLAGEFPVPRFSQRK
jgi:hypothetical protein